MVEPFFEGEQVPQVEVRARTQEREGADRLPDRGARQGSAGDKPEARKAGWGQATRKPFQPFSLNTPGSLRRVFKWRRSVRTKSQFCFQKLCLAEMSRMQHLLWCRQEAVTRDSGLIFLLESSPQSCQAGTLTSGEGHAITEGT